MLRNVSIAHSPDADDIFMYYAVKFGWVGINRTRFENTPLDIETLNVEALKGTYDVSAISFALYPHIKNEYALLKTAVSFGNGYGPKLIKKKNTTLKKRFKVALSGNYTTNVLLFRIAYPDATIVFKNFLDIEKAVIDGEVDAGVLIHESILTYSDTLEVERELWDVWCDLGKSELPLPLGGMAIRRSLPISLAIEIETVLTKAVEVARHNKNSLSKMLLERNLIRVDGETLEQYLELYANDTSVSMNDVQFNALNLLFKLGYDHGYYDTPIDATDYCLPHEYTALRNS